MSLIGKQAPSFTAPTNRDELFSFDPTLGKPTVLFFYPKDDTPGCTTEACSFRDSYAEFESLGITVIGISPDGAESHKKFAKKYDLPFVLASDTTTEIAQHYGVWVEKSLYGRKYMGVERSSFLVNSAGTVVQEWRKVKPANHVQEVLTFIQQSAPKL